MPQAEENLPDTNRRTTREVAAHDPSLSDGANAQLTRELRDVVGRDRVEVAGPDPDERDKSHARHSVGIASLFELRIELIITVLVLLVTVVLAAVANDAQWLVLVPFAVLVAAVVLVMRNILQVSTETEHLSPEVAARLENEGVAEPDKLFTDMLDDFIEGASEHGPAEVLHTGRNDRHSEASDDPAAAAQQQRTAMTPTSHLSHPSGISAERDVEET